MKKIRLVLTLGIVGLGLALGSCTEEVSDLQVTPVEESEGNGNNGSGGGDNPPPGGPTGS